MTRPFHCVDNSEVSAGNSVAASPLWRYEPFGDVYVILCGTFRWGTADTKEGAQFGVDSFNNSPQGQYIASIIAAMIPITWRVQ